MTNATLTVDAEKDLIDIYLYGIEAFGFPQAEKYLEALSNRIQLAAQNPSFGADYGFIRSGLRRYESLAHAVYYEETSSGILVFRVLYKNRDPARHI